MIFDSIDDFDSCWSLCERPKFVATSGGFDPLHVGHLRCIQESVSIVEKLRKETKSEVRLVVIVNGDEFLHRKKGYAFMPLQERMEIISGIKGVDYVVPWRGEDQTVTEALRMIRPIAFTKGGDRTSSENVPEFQLCESIGCDVIFNVGGGKIQSSSDLVSKMKEEKNASS